MLTKSRSYNEIRKRFNSNSSLSIASSDQKGDADADKVKGENHKTVIYFGDSISNRKLHTQQDQQRDHKPQQPLSAVISRNLSNKSDDFQHARRLCEEMVFKRHYSIRHPKSRPMANRLDKIPTKELSTDGSRSNMATFQSDQSLVMKELKHIVEVKLKNQITSPSIPPPPPPTVAMVAEKPFVPQKNIRLPHRTAPSIGCAQNDDKHIKPENENDEFLPSFVESVVDGVINIRIDGSYNTATKLVESFGRNRNDSVSELADNGSDIFLDVGGETVNNVYFDWSFVQDWRAGSPEIPSRNPNKSSMDHNNNMKNLHKMELYMANHDDHKSFLRSFNQSKSKTGNTKNATVNVEQQVHISNADHVSIHRRMESRRYCNMYDVQECHSSSEENRSSGHASMSENGHGSSSPGHTERNSLLREYSSIGDKMVRSKTKDNPNSTRTRHRITPIKPPWTGSEIKDIKLAIRQLTMGSQTSRSTCSSLSVDSENRENVRRLGRDFSSVETETINTNITTAEEFVWVDSRNRLVELQHPPWNQHCIMRVFRSGRCREHFDRISPETVPRLGYLLQRPLVRIAREAQRLSMELGLCSKHEIVAAFKIILAPMLADSCTKACLRAAAMFGIPGDSAFRQSKSSRAGLQLPVGRLHRWMTDARLGRFVHEYAAVYLCAGLENLVEEIVLQCMPPDENMQLTAIGLEHAIANNGDLWGLLEPSAHLNAGRIASGALIMPRWPNQSLGATSNAASNAAAMESCLLTTCVGSIAELNELINRIYGKYYPGELSYAAQTTLFYFMRCSQLERNEAHENCFSDDNSVQELCYERAYVILPSLIEWLRVATAHAEYRYSSVIDKDDIMQSARILLPGVDCPPRSILIDEDIPMRSKIQFSTPTTVAIRSNKDSQTGARMSIALAFRLMLSGKAELTHQATALLPTLTRYDTLNEFGLTALMLAAIRNDEVALQMLLDVGANVNVKVPLLGTPGCSAIHPETQHWTALTFAACRGNHQIVKTLLSRGARVEGGLMVGDEENCTLTPLQVASSSATSSLITLLLTHRANPFISTKTKDSLSFAATAQKGSYSAISVAVVHDNAQALQKLLNHPLAPASRDILSLEEMLAEDINSIRPAANKRTNSIPKLSKMQIKCLQEAMYHSAENNHLHITVEMRALGVPWTLHCWMHALAAAHELQLDDIVDQLLHDFLEVCPDDYNTQFIFECLPLLFNIFRFAKKNGTTLLLADIFATCFGWETIKPIKEPIMQPANGSRIDLKFVNNPELSDVMFRVEGKIFYAHKIVLVTASPRFQSLLSSKLSKGNTPTVQIHDIRYHIFQLVMQFLYSGACNSIDVATPADLLELMAAASFFQLSALVRYTESRCSQLIDNKNIVTMYIHAKVYDAPKLLEFCQGFLLQNIVTLLNYDESIKRLLFAKKIPNHDVIQSLLMALQSRIEYRHTGPHSTKLQRSSTQIK